MGEVWIVFELEIALSSGQFDALNLRRLIKPTGDERMEKMYREAITGANRDCSYPGFLLESNDGVQFYADRSLFLADTEGDYFRVRQYSFGFYSLKNFLLG